MFAKNSPLGFTFEICKKPGLSTPNPNFAPNCCNFCTLALYLLPTNKSDDLFDKGGASISPACNKASLERRATGDSPTKPLSDNGVSTPVGPQSAGIVIATKSHRQKAPTLPTFSGLLVAGTTMVEKHREKQRENRMLKKTSQQALEQQKITSAKCRMIRWFIKRRMLQCCLFISSHTFSHPVYKKEPSLLEDSYPMSSM